MMTSFDKMARYLLEATPSLVVRCNTLALRISYLKISLVFLVTLLLFFSPISAQTVSANWYSYFGQNGIYGIWARVFTPPDKPYTAPGDNQSHSVTTPGAPGGPWVQAGWRFYPSWDYAQRYYEYIENDVHYIMPLGNQLWGTETKYEVSYDGSTGSNRWCIWVGGARIGCWNDIIAAPCWLVAQSEAHTSTDTVFYTEFKDIRVRNAAGTWIYPTLAGNMGADPPYGYTITSSESFLTWRHGIFLPIVFK